MKKWLSNGKENHHWLANKINRVLIDWDQSSRVEGSDSKNLSLDKRVKTALTKKMAKRLSLY